MVLPGAVGAVKMVANVVQDHRQNRAAEDWNQAAQQEAEVLPVIANPIPETTSKAPTVERHRTIRKAIGAVTVLLVTGGVMYACSRPSGQSFGRHNNAVVNTTETTIGHAELTSDLSAATFDASNDSDVVGVAFNCYNPIPVGPAGCLPDSFHQASIHSTGKYKLTAHPGALAMTGRIDAKGQPIVDVDVDTTLLGSAISSSRHTVNAGRNRNLGLDGLANALGLGNQDKQATLETDAATNGDDAMQASITNELKGDPKVVDAAFAQALRTQVGSTKGLLSIVDGNGAKLLSEMANPKTTYVFNHHGQKLALKPEIPREFQAGQTVMIEGVKVTFGKDKPVAFSSQATKLMGNLEHDTTVLVTNQPVLSK